MNPNEILKLARQALDEVLKQKKFNQEFLAPAIIESLKPLLQELATNSAINKDDLLKAFESIKIEIPKIEVPNTQVDVKIPDISLPEIKIPTAQIEVKIPEIKVPPINVSVPEIKIPDKDMKETNKLLTAILKKMMKEKEDISIDLKIV